MNTVYAVWLDQGVDDIPLEGLFSTRALAKEFIENHPLKQYLGIQELVVDELVAA